MNEFLEIIKYTVPSIVTGVVAAYFLKQYVTEEQNKRNYNLLADKKKQSLPLRLQAYERMTLFLERIELTAITERVQPLEFNKIEYAQLLIHQINSEFEHNLVQQIYVTEDCWKLLRNSKQTTLNIITAQSMNDEISSGIELQQALQKEATGKDAPTVIAQQFIQQEVHKLF